MRTIFRRQPAVQVAFVVVAYWFGLLAISISPFDFTMPVLLIAGLPLLAFAGVVMWQSGAIKVDSLAFLDDLTGLHNRRAFTRRAMALIRHAKPGAASLVLIDVDDLKSINDDCGHLAGDELLERVALHLCRTNRAVYRVGGDEFAILVDRKDGESVTGLMRSLTPVRHAFRTCGHVHLIQFSYGFASRREGETFEQVFSRADARLRLFKARLYTNGRRKERRTVEVEGKADPASLPVKVQRKEPDGPSDGTVVSIFSRSRRTPVQDLVSGTGD